MSNLGPINPETKQATPRRATFFGTAFHKVSGKNQVATPRFMMKVLDEAQEGQVLLLRWNNEGYLRMYTQTELDRIVDEIRAREDLDEAAKTHLVRHLASSAVPIEPDKQGRFVLPAHWVKDLNLTEEVAFCGAFNRVEIWPAEARRDFDAQEMQRVAASAEKVTGILNL